MKDMIYCNSKCYEFDCPYNVRALMFSVYTKGVSLTTKDLSETSQCPLNNSERTGDVNERKEAFDTD